MESESVPERSTKETAVSEEVVSAVAATKRTDPMDLEPLYDVIDTDALDSLYERGGSRRARPPKRIEFTYSACEVVIAEDGAVSVSKIPPGERR